MRKIQIDLKLENDEQRKSIAKNFHDTAKALVVYALLEGAMKGSLSVATTLKIASLAIVCVAAGLRIEKTIGKEEQ